MWKLLRHVTMWNILFVCFYSCHITDKTMIHVIRGTVNRDPLVIHGIAVFLTQSLLQKHDIVQQKQVFVPLSVCQSLLGINLLSGGM